MIRIEMRIRANGPDNTHLRSLKEAFGVQPLTTEVCKDDICDICLKSFEYCAFIEDRPVCRNCYTLSSPNYDDPSHCRVVDVKVVSDGQLLMELHEASLTHSEFLTLLVRSLQNQAYTKSIAERLLEKKN